MTMIIGSRYNFGDVVSDVEVQPSKWNQMHIIELYKQREVLLNRKQLLMSLYPSQSNLLDDLEIGLQQLQTIINIKEHE